MIEGESPGAAAARLTGCAVTGERPLSGALTEVALDGGQSVMVKRAEAPGTIRAEAAGLRWLGDAGSVRVPAVRG
ncbi:fructosamine kinase, partial [Streptomyces sp. W16]|nr:fructosamine kinase [Streptomyces sp. W16]